jgi:hypothetical protein
MNASEAEERADRVGVATPALRSDVDARHLTTHPAVERVDSHTECRRGLRPAQRQAGHGSIGPTPHHASSSSASNARRGCGTTACSEPRASMSRRGPVSRRASPPPGSRSLCATRCLGGVPACPSTRDARAGARVYRALPALKETQARRRASSGRALLGAGVRPRRGAPRTAAGRSPGDRSTPLGQADDVMRDHAIGAAADSAAPAGLGQHRSTEALPRSRCRAPASGSRATALARGARSRSWRPTHRTSGTVALA